MTALEELKQELHQIWVVETQEQRRIRAELRAEEERKVKVFTTLHQQSATEHRKYLRALWIKIKSKLTKRKDFHNANHSI